jgi:hypothetical protein
MDPTVTVHSKNNAGEQFEISLTKVSVDTGSLRLKSWNSGQNPATDPPAKDNTLKLHDIKSLSTTGISCKSEEFGHLAIKCTLLPGTPPASSSVQVKITGSIFGILDGTKTYPITADDVTKLKKFLSDAAFPAAGTA